MKLVRGSRERTIQTGLAQVFRYADQCGADETHLIIFDQTPGLTWDEKIFRHEEVYEGTPTMPVPGYRLVYVVLSTSILS